MEIIRVPRIMQDTSLGERLHGRGVGFVPTMGALHEGHMNLVKVARAENDFVVVSVFVNPAQFGPAEDFDSYPRDIEGDMEKLGSAGVDVLFLPEAGAMYPEGFSTSVNVKGLSRGLCGPFRPGHFEGVATVLTKLLNIAMPKRAYFGQKDYQQSLIIKTLVRDLAIPTEVVVVPTQREPDGLAMSSRNAYLGVAERKAAAVIFKTLTAASEKIISGMRSARAANDMMADMLKAEPLVSEVQYANAYDPETLEELSMIEGDVLLAIAVNIGDTRLIDNVMVKKGDWK